MSRERLYLADFHFSRKIFPFHLLRRLAEFQPTLHLTIETQARRTSEFETSAFLYFPLFDPCFLLTTRRIHRSIATGRDFALRKFGILSFASIRTYLDLITAIQFNPYFVVRKSQRRLSGDTPTEIYLVKFAEEFQVFFRLIGKRVF